MPAAATPTPRPVVLPKDAAPHDALTEWWYFTGHLSADDGHAYGFEFTVFQVRRQEAPTGYLAHFAITDVDNQRFTFEARAAQGEPRAQFPLRVQDWSLTGENTIQAAMQNAAYALQLSFTDEKPAALHHGGFIDNEPAGGSYYYSRTRLIARGELRDGDGQPQSVQGQAWMDHQWGNFVVVGGGWDWYSLQLDDRSELMLYVLRNGTEVSAVYGSEVLPDGSVHDLAPDEVRSEPIGTWTSPHTGAVYPSGWRLSLRDREQLLLTPLAHDQELYFNGLGPTYWEGAVAISGGRTGRGYVELTGYAAP